MPKGLYRDFRLTELDLPFYPVLQLELVQLAGLPETQHPLSKPVMRWAPVGPVLAVDQPYDPALHPPAGVMGCERFCGIHQRCPSSSSHRSIASSVQLG